MSNITINTGGINSSKFFEAINNQNNVLGN